MSAAVATRQVSGALSDAQVLIQRLSALKQIFGLCSTLSCVAHAKTVKDRTVPLQGCPASHHSGRLRVTAFTQVVDFESLAFAGGAHFKSSKTTGLPEGSFRSSKKGYDEV